MRTILLLLSTLILVSCASKPAPVAPPPAPVSRYDFDWEKIKEVKDVVALLKARDGGNFWFNYLHGRDQQNEKSYQELKHLLKLP